MTDDVLSNYISDNALVSIKRQSLAPETLQAFLVSYTRQLLCMRYIRDFLDDGYLILRRSDVSAVECRATDRFQRRLIADAGQLPDRTKWDAFRLDSIPNLLASLDETEIVIVECESLDGDVFTIGRFAGMDDDGFIAIHEFSGAANWDDNLTTLDIDDVTCVQLRSNYILPYQHYFDRIGFPELPNDR